MKLNKRGTILVTSLWIMAILAILAMGIGFRISIEGRLARYNMDRIRSLYLAKAGIVKAEARLTSSVDSLKECGIVLDTSKEETVEGIFKNVQLAGGSFSVGYTEGGVSYVGMSDEARKIDINKIGAAGGMPRAALEQLLILSGCADTNSKTLVDSIIAWRNPDPNSSENSLYESLGYERKGGDFSVKEELLLVNGMTSRIYNSIKDYITVYGDGKVNINTAPEKVLLAVVTAANTGTSLTPANIVANILDFRNKQSGIFRSDTDMQSILTAAPLNLLPNEASAITNLFTTKSTCFRIESEGAVAGSLVKKKIVAVINRNSGADKKLQYYREY